MSPSRMFVTTILMIATIGCDAAKKEEQDEKTAPPRSSSNSNPTVSGTAQSVRGAVSRTGAMNDLRHLGQAYEAYRTLNGKSPTDLDDLDLKKEAPGLHAAIQSGAIVVIWGAERSPEAILAYEAEEVGGGTRVVLMGDGSVKSMSNQEFETTPKAKGK